MKRICTLLGLLFMTFGLPVNATSVTPSTPAAQAPIMPKVSEAELNQGVTKLLAIILGCDLDDVCTVSMLDAMVKSDPNYLFTTYLRLANLRKEEINFNATNCKTEQTQAVKKLLANCLSTSIGSLNSMAVFLKRNTEELTEQCIDKQMPELANSGNVYALAIMTERTLKSGDTQNYQYWITSLRGQVKASETGNIQKCANSLAGAIKLFDETVRTVAKEQGIKVPD